MSFTRTVLLLSGVGIAAAAGAARIRIALAQPSASAANAQLPSPTAFSLSVVGANLEVYQETESSDPESPYDFVILRRTAGTSTIDCGAFDRPVVRDDGVTRRWVYSMPRPKSATCATTSGARFAAVGQKGTSQRQSNAVP
jgi:hypothetical protein